MRSELCVATLAVCLVALQCTAATNVLGDQDGDQMSGVPSTAAVTTTTTKEPQQVPSDAKVLADHSTPAALDVSPPAEKTPTTGDPPTQNPSIQRSSTDQQDQQQSQQQQTKTGASGAKSQGEIGNTSQLGQIKPTTTTTAAATTKKNEDAKKKTTTTTVAPTQEKSVVLTTSLQKHLQFPQSVDKKDGSSYTSLLFAFSTLFMLAAIPVALAF